MIHAILLASLLSSQPPAQNPQWEPADEDEPAIVALADHLKKDRKPYRPPPVPHIPIRVNQDRAILFYSAHAETGITPFRELSIYDVLFEFRTYCKEPSPENARLINVAKSLPSGWFVSHGEDAHIQLVCVEDKKELAAAMKVKRDDCPMFIRLHGGMSVFKASASGWSGQHLMGMWKNAIKPTTRYRSCLP